MKELVKVNLENEMDLILAHRRSMKLSELCGLSLSAQTIFATAISEIARCAIDNGKSAFLSLGIDILRGNKKNICGWICDSSIFCNEKSEYVIYARRLIKEVAIEKNSEG